MKVLISNTKKVEEIKKEMQRSGPDKIHVLSDFDRTLTYGTTNGIKTPSIISMLRDGKHLTDDYADKAHSLFNKYHPLESDLNIPLRERKELMQEWWKNHHDLLIKSGLSKNDLEDTVKNGHVKFREGVPEFVDLLYNKKIPLVIMSACGCGEAVKMFFQKIKKDHSNIFYIINKYHWDKNGKALSAKEPIIHALNKDETVLENFPNVYKHIKERKKVILLGDSIGDIDMIKGFRYEKLLKIGFLNSGYERLREKYLDSFDIVLEGDKDFYFINKLFKEIILKKNFKIYK